MATKLLRQGDVGLVRMSAPPTLPEGKELRAEKRKLIRRGENGGVHELATLEKATIYGLFGNNVKVAEERYIEVKETTQVVHKEHAPITLEPGWYKVNIQREQFQDQIRYSQD